MPAHELHLTISPKSGEDAQLFQQWCLENGCKYVMIELPDGAKFPMQPMLGKWFTSFDAAMTWGKNSVKDLKNNHNIKTSRLKVETVTSQFPKEYKSKPDEYWEYHLKIHFHDVEEKERLATWLRTFEAKSHLSKSALGVKPKDGIGFYNFVTLRLFELTRDEAENRLKRLADKLQENGLNVVSVQKELCVYDSNKDLDAGWL